MAITDHEKQPVCDYEGSAYKTEFWGQEREYEDAVERVALEVLLPPAGTRLIEIGAGFGRLAPLYAGYEEVVFFDYALSQLRQAREMWGECGSGGLPRYTYVAGDFYNLPFATGLFETITMVRTLHHAADAPVVLKNVSRILAPSGTFVLEYANKRNVKSILRYLAGRQDWSPFAYEPVEFVKLNFDFHPVWMRNVLCDSGLEIQKLRTVSHFRLGVLKRVLPTGVLVAMDRIVQPTGQLWQLSPSVFVRCTISEGQSESTAQGTFFRCTACGSEQLVTARNELSCVICGARYGLRDGIWDFKTPIDG